MTATIPDWVSVRFIRLGLVKMGPVDHLSSSLVKCRIPTTPTPLPRIPEVNFLEGGLRSCSFNKLPRWFLFLNWRKWSESESEVAQSCPTLCDPTAYNLHQAPPSMGFSRQEYWSGLPFPSPRGSSQPRDRTQISHIAGRRFTLWATREVQLENHKANYQLILQICSPGMSWNKETSATRQNS